MLSRTRHLRNYLVVLGNAACLYLHIVLTVPGLAQGSPCFSWTSSCRAHSQETWKRYNRGANIIFCLHNFLHVSNISALLLTIWKALCTASYYLNYLLRLDFFDLPLIQAFVVPHFVHAVADIIAVIAKLAFALALQNKKNLVTQNMKFEKGEGRNFKSSRKSLFDKKKWLEEAACINSWKFRNSAIFPRKSLAFKKILHL